MATFTPPLEFFARPAMLPWVLHDRTGACVAASVWAFPTTVMTECDARTVQEFAEDLTLHLTALEDGGSAWCGKWEELPALQASTPFPNRADALRAATVAVGLLPVASVSVRAVGPV